jgi:ribose 5-phosphate isomerase B
MIIAIGFDQAGYALRDVIYDELRAFGAQVRDLCPEPVVDYPDAAQRVGEAVASGAAELGILICGTGVGMSIAANKVPGVRAAQAAEPYTARMSREHNDANVLCMGARAISSGVASEIVQAWLRAAPSMEDRHLRRRDKVCDLAASARESYPTLTR